MEDEFSEIMHRELTVSGEDEIILKAGCVWHTWCNQNSSKDDIEKYAKLYSISYDDAMKWKEYWLDKYKKNCKQ